ncbi:MAG: recombinase family protein [Oligoflexales bacterium]
MRRIGYVRVSTDEQNLALQLQSLKEAGCQEIFEDKISDAKSSRPGLDAMMHFLEKGDCVIVWRLDRLGRSMIDLINIVNSFNNRGIGFKSLSDNIVDTSSPSGEMLCKRRLIGTFL